MLPDWGSFEVFFVYRFFDVFFSDEGGVFKVKEVRQELHGAQEVKEDFHTHVEVPVDQVC